MARTVVKQNDCQYAIEKILLIGFSRYFLAENDSVVVEEIEVHQEEVGEENLFDEEKMEIEEPIEPDELKYVKKRKPLLERLLKMLFILR